MEYAAGTSRSAADGRHYLKQFWKRPESGVRERHGL